MPMVGFDIFLQTTFPIFFLIGMGLISRKMNILKEEDEKILGAYLYYFALPSLILVNLSEIVFTKETYRFMIVGILPIIVVLIIYILSYFIFRISKNKLYLMIISTTYSNTAFYGIPFITFAFPTKQAEYLATLTVSSISVVVIISSILILELYKLESTTVISGLKVIIKRFLKNPMILSVLIGSFLSIIGFKIPLPIYNPLHMMGNTTSTVALFILGVFIYGRRFTNILQSFKYSLLKIIFLPIVSIIILKLFHLPSIENYIIVLMHGMPLGLSMTVLSEQYDFYKETIASLMLISSIAAGIYLNLLLVIVETIF